MGSDGEPTFVLSEHARHVIRERGIRLGWITQTLAEPARTDPDRDDPDLLHALRRVEAHGGRVLRVVYNPTGSPILVVTAYFDRSMKDQL